MAKRAVRRDPLRRSWDIAKSDQDRLAALFEQIGVGGEAGAVTTPYRVARNALQSILTRPERFRLAEVKEVLDDLRVRIESATRNAVAQGVSLGRASAVAQLREYGYRVRPVARDDERIGAAVGAVMADVDRQLSVSLALVVTGVEPEMVVGMAGRGGVLVPAAIVTGLTYWSSQLGWLEFGDVVEGASAQTGAFNKQVASTLDELTTECCLMAHGQIKAMDEQFETTGEPHFATLQDWTPFHWYCRSDVVLYREEYDYGLTERMTTGAQELLAERAAGERAVRHPASGLIS